MNLGTELTTFITGLNGDATIDPTLLATLVQSAQAIIEEEREWMNLRKTDTSLTLATSNTWQTAKSIATITDFSRFYGEEPIRLFDGNERIDYYDQVPFDRRLEYKNVGGTFVHDANAGNVYFNGRIQFAGTLYINYIAASPAIDPASASAVWSVFPSRFLPLVGFYAIGIHKGAVDYDGVTKLMLPENRATMEALKNAMEKWDNNLQLSAIESNDPTDMYGGHRDRAINRD